MQANAAVDRDLRNEALVDLCARVDDWKNHRVDHFGDLLLHGHFPVVTGKSDVQKEVRPRYSTFITATSIRNIKETVGSKCKAALKSHLHTNSKADESECDSASSTSTPIFDQCHWPGTIFFQDLCVQHLIDVPQSSPHLLSMEFANSLGSFCPHSEQYTIYLFERILLCCKEINPNKSKDKLMGAQKDKKDKKYNKKEINKNAKLQLKGRIFMTNVTEVLSLAKQGSAFKPVLLVMTLTCR